MAGAFLPPPWLVPALGLIGLGGALGVHRVRRSLLLQLDASRKQLAASLERSEAIQEACRDREDLLAHAPVAILRVETGPKIRFVNEAGAWLFGRTRESILADGLAVLGGDGLMACAKRALEGERSRATLNLPGGANGDRIVRVFFAPLKDVEGRDKGAVLVLQDEDEAMRAVDEVRQVRHRFDHLVASIPSGVYRFLNTSDGEMRFEYVSDKFCDLLGVEREDVLRDPLIAFQAAHPEDLPSLMEANMQALQEFSPFRWEGRFVVDGEVRWLRIESDGKVLEEGGTVWNGVVSDSTRHYLIQEELKAAKVEAEAAAKAKGEFLATMSHEVRTPMNGVLGLLQLALREERDMEQRVRLQKAYGAGSALLDILNDVLDWSRIESGSLVLENIEFDLREVLQGVADLFEPIIASRGVRFETDVAPELPLLVRGDPHRLRQVLSNLVGNAAKFTSNGRIRMEAFVGEVDESRIELRLAVRDSGIGIPWERLDKLFQPFQQIDSGVTRKFGGTGLGLAICRNLVERMEGTILAESELGKGSAFLVSVRLGLVGEYHRPESHANLVDRAVDRKRRKILLVEDNALNQEVAKGMLEFAGYEVIAAWDGQECLDILASQRVDLILMDLHMPVMGGLEAARKLRFLPHGQGVPVVALTADVRPAVIRDCQEAGMVAHVGKPFDPSRLLALIEEHVAEEAKG